jgi:hypothetical protein
MSVDYIIFNHGHFKGLPIQTVSFNPDREPILFGEDDPVSFEVLAFDVIHGHQQKFHLLTVFIKFIFSLLYILKILHQEIDEVPHVRLIDGLSGGRLNQRVVDGKSELQRRQPSKGLDRRILIPSLIKNGHPGIGGDEINPDPFIPQVIELELIALILFPVQVEDLFHLAGIILHGLERGFHSPDDGKNPAFLRPRSRPSRVDDERLYQGKA